jgi:hypothetical protein
MTQTAGSAENRGASGRLTPTFLVTGGETVVASAVATQPPYNADNTGARDATAAVQAALDTVGKVNGGVVFLPAGRYRIEGSLRLGYGTTLMGEWQPPAEGRIDKGTVLLAYAGRGDESAPPLITLPPHQETCLRNLTVWYPEQRPDDVQPYPFTIAGGSARVTNVTLCNSYNGIDLGLFNACVVENVHGTVLNRGIVAPESFEFSWMHDVRFANDYWERAASALTGIPFTAEQRAALDRFTQERLTGLEIGRIDGLAIYRYSADHAKTPILVRKNDRVDQHPVFGFGGVAAGLRGRREEHGWDPWYYGMHYANLDNVPEARGKSYTFARIPTPSRTEAASFFDVTRPPYSATGEGEQDDTASIQRALRAAGALGGGTVYLPQGEYRITGPLVVPPGVELRGPLGTAKVREHRETCSLAVYCGRGTANPETDPAALTLMDHAGVRGLTLVYPDQAYDATQLQPFPYAVRGHGKGVWIADVHLLNAYHGIDLATHRCDEHVVVGVWGTAFCKGIDVGGNSRGGKLERIAFSYGPWTEAGRLGSRRTEAGKAAIADFCRQHSVHYSFGDCVGETAWGLVGFYPKTHFHFYRDKGRGCIDAELWLSVHDVADVANVQADSGENIHLLGYFGTGGRDGKHNWLEVGPEFRGPLHVHAKTIQQTFLNHPLQSAPEQVRFHDEVSLTTGKPATASDTAPGSGPENAVDRDPRTVWEAPAGSYLQVDLGGVRAIDRFGIEGAGLFQPATLNVATAELHVSTDGKSFSLAGRLSARPGGVHQPHPYAWADAPVEPVQARYVRLVVTDAGGDGRIHLATFSVFGPEAAQ